MRSPIPKREKRDIKGLLSAKTQNAQYSSPPSPQDKRLSLRPCWWLFVRPLPGSPIEDYHQLKHDLKALKRDRRLMLECLTIIDETDARENHAKRDLYGAKPHSPKVSGSGITGERLCARPEVTAMPAENSGAERPAHSRETAIRRASKSPRNGDAQQPVRKAISPVRRAGSVACAVSSMPADPGARIKINQTGLGRDQ